MFNIGMAEIILLLLIAFIVVGPDDLPKVARALGRFVRYVRNIIKEIKRETGLDEVAEELHGVRREIEQDLKEADVRNELKHAEKEINEGLRDVEKAVNVSGIKKDIEKGIGGKST